MTKEQIAMAWERIELYLDKVTANSSPLGFSPIELKALAERKAALTAAVGG